MLWEMGPLASMVVTQKWWRVRLHFEQPRFARQTKKAVDLSIDGLCVSKLVGMRGFEPPTP